MNKQRFASACETVFNTAQEQGQQRKIGTLGEKVLHAVLKHYIEPDETKHEVKVGSFYADIVNDHGIFEIQTRSFFALRKKLEVFLEISPVTVVYPIPGTKWLLWIDPETGEVTKKRKSPKRGGVNDAFSELFRIKHLLDHENFHLLIMFLDVEEYRYLDGWSENRKRGSSRCDRIPVDIVGEVCFNKTADYLQFIPEGLPCNFTSKDYKRAANVSLRTAQTALNILHQLSVVQRVGKKGNLYVYGRV